MPISQSKYIVHNTLENSVDLYLYGYIGRIDDGNEVDGNYISEQIRYFDSIGVTIINEHINSDGGEITNGLSIVNANLNCKNAKIYTYNDGVAASMAGIIHQTGSKKFAAPYSQFMMHEPSIWGENIDTTTDPIVKKRLEAAKYQLLSILYASTGLEISKLEEMMHQETWMNAEECEKLGFVSKGCVMSYPNKSIIKQNSSPKDILTIVNQAFNLTNNKMAKTTCAKCGEKFDFEEGKDVMSCPGCKAKVNNKGEMMPAPEPVKEPAKKDEIEPITNSSVLVDRLNSLENQIKGFKAENATLKAERDAEKQKFTATILNKAIEDGRILDTAKDALLASYGTNPDGLIQLISFLPQAHNSIGSVIKANDTSLPGGFTSIREMEKKNPEMAEKFALENPVAYDKFYNSEYK